MWTLVHPWDQTSSQHPLKRPLSGGRSWARARHSSAAAWRLRPCPSLIGLPNAESNAEFLRRGPPPAYARGRAAVGGAEPWPQVHPGILRGARAAAGL